MMDSSTFNQPTMEEQSDYKRGSYVPQYAVARQHLSKPAEGIPQAAAPAAPQVPSGTV